MRRKNEEKQTNKQSSRNVVRYSHELRKNVEGI